MRRAAVLGMLAVLCAATSAHAMPRLPQRNPDRIVTTMSFGVSDASPATVQGKALGPDVPLAKLSGTGGYMLADTEVGCSVDVLQPVPFVLDAGWGDVLYGDIVAGGGGTLNQVSFTLKATGGEGRYAGWTGWGSFDGVIANTCSNDFTGVWKINRV